MEQISVEMRMKHLELLQGAIIRMGTNSSNLKTAAMTVTTAVLALASAVSRPGIILQIVPIVMLFAVIDARYLALERGFRDSYDRVRMQPLSSAPDFAVTSEPDGLMYLSSLFSWSVGLFYGAIVFLMLSVWHAAR